ncbi:hypothetical protein KX928_22955, partial [Roseobacter sp. YSTF-M11]
LGLPAAVIVQQSNGRFVRIAEIGDEIVGAKDRFKRILTVSAPWTNGWFVDIGVDMRANVRTI